MLTTSQALEFGEIQEMADKAGLFKSVNHVYGNQTLGLRLIQVFQIRCEVAG